LFKPNYYNFAGGRKFQVSSTVIQDNEWWP